jgi:hypothetical protein
VRVRCFLAGGEVKGEEGGGLFGKDSGTTVFCGGGLLDANHPCFWWPESGLAGGGGLVRGGAVPDKGAVLRVCPASGGLFRLGEKPLGSGG